MSNKHSADIYHVDFKTHKIIKKELYSRTVTKSAEEIEHDLELINGLYQLLCETATQTNDRLQDGFMVLMDQDEVTGIIDLSCRPIDEHYLAKSKAFSEYIVRKVQDGKDTQPDC